MGHHDMVENSMCELKDGSTLIQPSIALYFGNRFAKLEVADPRNKNYMTRSSSTVTFEFLEIK